jgi:hemerythrin-like domain-containing protein
MLHLHNEHKYITKLLNILLEQNRLIKAGNPPDLNIMYDVARYMGEFSDTSHHPREDVIYRKLSKRDPKHKEEVVNLLIDHEALTKKTESLLRTLEDALRAPDETILQTLHLRCEDYISSLNSHMDLEESRIFPRVLEALTEEDWADILHDIQPDNDPLFGKIVEKRYQELFDAISYEMGRAADEFTMAELVGLGAAMENIGMIATHTNSVASVVSRRFREAYRSNAVAFRKLRRSHSTSPGDYVSVTIDCMLNNFDTYTDALKDISRVLRKARTQIAEPYTSRLRIYHDMSRNKDAGPTHPVEKV